MLVIAIMIVAVGAALHAATGMEMALFAAPHSLDAWDRVINGWGYIHGVASYQKSITLLF